MYYLWNRSSNSACLSLESFFFFFMAEDEHVDSAVVLIIYDWLYCLQLLSCFFYVSSMKTSPLFLLSSKIVHIRNVLPQCAVLKKKKKKLINVINQINSESENPGSAREP